VAWQILRRNANTESSTTPLEMKMMRDTGWSLTSAIRPIRLILPGIPTHAIPVETSEVVAALVDEIEIRIDTVVGPTVAVHGGTETKTRERTETGNEVVTMIAIADDETRNPCIYV
jgi:hypothetical protein